MNPVDHPMGGGEGRTSGGRHPCSPWGMLTKGLRTRNNKRTQVFIVSRGRSKHAAFRKEGSVRRLAPARKVEVRWPRGQPQGDQDLVAPVDHPAAVRRRERHGPQRQQVDPGVHHREHGRPQARRVRARPAPSAATPPTARRKKIGDHGHRTPQQHAVTPRKMRGHREPHPRPEGRHRDQQPALPAQGRRASSSSSCSSRPSPTPRTRATSTSTTLVVSKVTVDQGPTLKRWRPRAMGRANRILKKTSHITLEVAEA
jgi:hypothetical protein